MTRVVIFGAAGFVGRNMIRHLEEEGYDVLASDFLDSPFPADIRYEKVDITVRDDVIGAVKDAEIVIHLAASSLTTSLKDPVLDSRINVGGSLNIMDACRQEDVDIIVYSSASSVVGTLQYNPVDEDHPAVPRTPYAASKLAIENYLRVYKEIYGLDYLVFRFFNIYGPWQYPGGGGLIPVMLSRMLNNETITIFGDGSATRDFVYIGDLVKFYSLALDMDIKNGLFNMGTGLGSSIVDVVRAISEVIGKTPNIEYKPKREGEIDNFYADTNKLEKHFGSKPRTTLKEGLANTYEWFKAEGL